MADLDLPASFEALDAAVRETLPRLARVSRGEADRARVDLDVAALSEVVRRVLDVALTLADEQQAFVGQVASEMAGLMIGLPDPERVSGLRSRQRTYAENVEIVTGLVRWVDDSTSLIAA